MSSSVEAEISAAAAMVRDQGGHARLPLDRLLELTRPASTWQPALLQLLGQHIVECDARRLLAFLTHVILSGKDTLCRLQRQGKRKRNQDNLVPIDYQLAPKIFDIDRWKKILIALGFEIEQPDGHHRLEYVDVLVGDGVMAPALDGMLALLSIIGDLSWTTLRMILNLTTNEASDMMLLVENKRAQTSLEVTDQSMAKTFLSRYPDEMKQMGFEKEHKIIVKRCGCDQIQLCETLSLVLYTLFDEGPPDTGTFI